MVSGSVFAALLISPSLTLDDLHLPRMAHALSLFTETILQAPTEEELLFLQP